MNLEELQAASDSILQNAQEEATKKASSKKIEREKDARFWTPTIDENVTGSATIRFLPPPRNDTIKAPKIEYWEYNIKTAEGQYYIEKSINSLHQYHPDQKEKIGWDPMGEYNSKLFKIGTEESKKQASAQKRSHRMIANILVVDDPANPENNGKVFLYKFGPQIWNIVDALMFPPKGSKEAPCNPLDFWKGFDLNLVIVPNGKVEKGKKPFPTYIKSSFARTATPIADTNEGIAEIYSKVFPLSEFVDPKAFKTREQLQSRLNKVFGLGEASTSAAKPTETRKQLQDLETAMADTSISSGPIDMGNDDDGEVDIDSILASIK